MNLFASELTLILTARRVNIFTCFTSNIFCDAECTWKGDFTKCFSFMYCNINTACFTRKCFTWNDHMYVIIYFHIQIEELFKVHWLPRTHFAHAQVANATTNDAERRGCCGRWWGKWRQIRLSQPRSFTVLWRTATASMLSLLELLFMFFIREGVFSCSLLSTSETDHLVDFICTAWVVDINNDTSTILICHSLILNFVIFIDIICYVCRSSSLSVHVWFVFLFCDFAHDLYNKYKYSCHLEPFTQLTVTFPVFTPEPNCLAKSCMSCCL